MKKLVLFTVLLILFTLQVWSASMPDQTSPKCVPLKKSQLESPNFPNAAGILEIKKHKIEFDINYCSVNQYAGDGNFVASACCMVGARKSAMKINEFENRSAKVRSFVNEHYQFQVIPTTAGRYLQIEVYSMDYTFAKEPILIRQGCVYGALNDDLSLEEINPLPERCSMMSIMTAAPTAAESNTIGRIKEELALEISSGASQWLRFISF